MNKPSYLTWSEEYTYADDGSEVIRRPVLYDIFIQELREFLNENGFVLDPFNNVMISDLAHRVYNATYSFDRKYAKFENMGNKTADEFEMYTDNLTQESWEHFLDKWKDVDDFKQGTGFTTILSIIPFFAWKYINVDKSMAFLCDEMADMWGDEDGTIVKTATKTKKKLMFSDPYIQDQQDVSGKYGRRY